MNTFFLKPNHNFNKENSIFSEFLDDFSKVGENSKILLGLNYNKSQVYYSLDCDNENYNDFEAQFYTTFNEFKIESDYKNTIWNYDLENTVLGEITLENKGFYPFKINNSSNFIYNLFRQFEKLNNTTDKFGFFIEVEPLSEENLFFYIQYKIAFILFKLKLYFLFLKYLFKNTSDNNWKKQGNKYFAEKIKGRLYKTKVYLLMQSDNKKMAENKLNKIFSSFSVFKNYPLNKFNLKIKNNITINNENLNSEISNLIKSNIFSGEEINNLYYFSKKLTKEASLYKENSTKLPVPIGIPTTKDIRLKNGEKQATNILNNMNILGFSNYRSINIPIGVYDEDRLKHTYIIGKTGTGKSKLITNLVNIDLQNGKGVAVIDPHGDLIEDILMQIPKEREKDLIIFDPTDTNYPFCFNPLKMKPGESKQIITKGFIDIFKKFFGVNWNDKLEHVLRMIILALLDKKDSTVFDIVRALTDRDFRYDMIETIEEDVVKNFWTNEFSGWSQNFNNEAIMPIINKIGQLFSINYIKNIFANPENKLDLSEVLSENKILLIKLSKGALQEEVMGFLGAMFVTKIYQTAMGKQNIDRENRNPYFLYIDEFQNFATDTFNEILSEARKYGLGLTVSHQFLKQIPINISNALFGNIGTLISFRVSSEDALILEKQFSPFVDNYSLANLNQRDFYAKLTIKGESKNPISLRTQFSQEQPLNKDFIEKLYNISRKKYCKKVEKQVENNLKRKKEDKKSSSFIEPII
ncbi:MAG: type IV secretion system DNA-binding domain-containing protein [Candidatus Gracilibacteria bacterium]|nr:type IV secretion system DNA-binding domain-containing protein [Candidatus Gracilibacteria bacterium]